MDTDRDAEMEINDTIFSSLSRIKYCSSPWNITSDRTETKKLRNNNITRYGNLNSSLVSALRYNLIYEREKRDLKMFILEWHQSQTPRQCLRRGMGSCQDMFNCNNKEGEGSSEWLSGEWWSWRRHVTWPPWQVGTWHVSHVTNNTNITKDEVYHYEAENIVRA